MYFNNAYPFFMFSARLKLTTTASRTSTVRFLLLKRRYCCVIATVTITNVVTKDIFGSIFMQECLIILINK